MADVKYRVDIDTKGAQTAINGLGNTIRTVGASIAGAFAFREVSQTGAKLDDLRRTFGTLYRSIETGNKAFSDVQTLASKFGLGVEDLATTIIKLKSAGIDPTVAQLKLFSDVSKSSVDSMGALQAITDLFTRTMAGGLGLEDLERLQDRGIPVYTILAEKAGIARSQISELGQTMEGASRIRGVLAEGLNEMFGGATESRANSMSTAFINFQNAIKRSSDTLIQGGLGDAIVTITNTITEWINNNQDLIAQIGGVLARAMEILVNNLGVITSAARIFFTVFAAQKIVALTQAFVSMSKALVRNPILLLAVGAIVAAEKMGLLEQAFDAIGESMEKLFGLDEINAEIEDLKANIETIPDIQLFEPGKIETANKDFSDLNDSLKDFRLELVKTYADYRRANDLRRNSIELETELLGKSREFQELKRSEIDMLVNCLLYTSPSPRDS